MPLGWHTHSCKHHGFMLTISLQNTLQFRKDPVICIWSFYVHFKIEAESKTIVKNNLICMSSVFTADPVFQRYLSSWWEHHTLNTTDAKSLWKYSLFHHNSVFEQTPYSMLWSSQQTGSAVFCAVVHPSGIAHLSPLTTQKSSLSLSEASPLGGLPARMAGFRYSSIVT